ncbi:MAG: PAS domain-containing protein [Chloroflexi bacterium]|nr:PAS domain-containing protein [Chloroflexota bacterium]
MNEQSARRLVVLYGLPAVASGVSFLMWLIAQPLLFTSVPLLFLAVVLVSAYYGGFGPGLLATALGAAGIVASFEYARTTERLAVSLSATLIPFAALALTITTLAARFRSVRKPASAAADIRDPLLRIPKSLWHQLPEGVIVADVSGRIAYMNPSAIQVHGNGAASAPRGQKGSGRGSPGPAPLYCQAYALLTPSGEPLARSECPMCRAALNGETIIEAAWRVRRRDGTAIALHGNAGPVLAEDRSRIGAVLLVRDVTVQEVLEEQRGEFLSIATHDLKNPLAGISGLAQVLQRHLDQSGTIDPDRLHRRLTLIISSAQRVLAQIENISAITRQRADSTVVLRRARCDLAALTRAAIEAHQQTTDRHELRAHLPEHEVVGYWDGAWLGRVLENLLGNAIKYSPGGGTITVTLAVQREENVNARALLTVRDQGLGIPEADRPHIFERYHRAQNVVGRIAGTGIGLAAARQIVELHGGRISVESEEGVGSAFTVTLPIDPSGTQRSRTNNSGESVETNGVSP